MSARPRQPSQSPSGNQAPVKRPSRSRLADTIDEDEAPSPVPSRPVAAGGRKTAAAAAAGREGSSSAGGLMSGQGNIRQAPTTSRDGGSRSPQTPAVAATARKGKPRGVNPLAQETSPSFGAGHGPSSPTGSSPRKPRTAASTGTAGGGPSSKQRSSRLDTALIDDVEGIQDEDDDGLVSPTSRRSPSRGGDRRRSNQLDSTTSADVEPPPVNRGTDSWSTPIWDCSEHLHPLFCEVLLCHPCNTSLQIQATQDKQDSAKINPVPCVGVIVFNLLTCGMGSLMASLFLRRTVKERFDIGGEELAPEVALACCCAPCSLGQTDRELRIRGKAPHTAWMKPPSLQTALTTAKTAGHSASSTGARESSGPNRSTSQRSSRPR